MCTTFDLENAEAQEIVITYSAALLEQVLPPIEERYAAGKIRHARQYLLAALRKAKEEADAAAEDAERKAKETSRVVKLEERRSKRDALVREAEKAYIKHRDEILRKLDVERVIEFESRFVDHILSTEYRRMFQEKGFKSRIICSLLDEFMGRQLLERHPDEFASLDKDVFVAKYMESRQE